MPSLDAQWIIGTIIAVAIALGMQIGGIRADVRELRADMREDLRDMRQDLRDMRTGLRGIDDRLRAVEQAVKPDQPVEQGGASPSDAALLVKHARLAPGAASDPYGWSVARSWARSPPRMLVML